MRIVRDELLDFVDRKKDSGKKPSNVMQVEEKCHYVGSGMVIR